MTTAIVRVTDLYPHPPRSWKTQTRLECWTAVQHPTPGEPGTLVFDVFDPLKASAFERAFARGRLLRVTYHDSKTWRQVDAVEFVEPTP